MGVSGAQPPQWGVGGVVNGPNSHDVSGAEPPQWGLERGATDGVVKTGVLNAPNSKLG